MSDFHAITTDEEGRKTRVLWDFMGCPLRGLWARPYTRNKSDHIKTEWIAKYHAAVWIYVLSNLQTAEHWLEMQKIQSPVIRYEFF